MQACFPARHARERKGVQKREVIEEIKADSREGKWRFPRHPGASRLQPFWLLLVAGGSCVPGLKSIWRGEGTGFSINWRTASKIS
jgi:hypothetical protein